MSGYFYRLKPVDFRLRTSSGAVKARTSPTGPSRYEELAPFYDKAEEELGVSGNAVPHPFAEPRKKPYPLPPLDAHPIGEGDRQGVQGARLARRSPPRAASSAAPYQGRAPCMLLRALRQLRLRARREERHQRALIPARARHRQRGPAPALHGDADRGRRARAARRASSTWTQTACAQEQPAKFVVVSCTAVESARLLLNSKSSRFPNGLANDSGLGRQEPGVQLASASRARTSACSKNKERWPWLDDRGAVRATAALQDFYLMPDDKLRLPQGRHARLHVDAPEPHLRGGAAWRAAARAASSARSSRTACASTATRAILQFEIYGEFLAHRRHLRLGRRRSVKDKYGLPGGGDHRDAPPAGPRR